MMVMVLISIPESATTFIPAPLFALLLLCLVCFSSILSLLVLIARISTLIIISQSSAKKAHFSNNAAKRQEIRKKELNRLKCLTKIYDSKLERLLPCR